MRKFILSLSLISFVFTASGVYAAKEFTLPELEWGAKRDAIAAKAQGELYHEEDAWLWYTFYDAYDGCIIDTQYRFNANNELYYASWHIQPQSESNVDLQQMLTEYNRLKDALLLRYAAPYDNQVTVKHNEIQNVTYPDTPLAPTAADIPPGTQYSIDCRWKDNNITIFLYLLVSEKGKVSIDIAFNNGNFE